LNYRHLSLFRCRRYGVRCRSAAHGYSRGGNVALWRRFEPMVSAFPLCDDGSNGWHIGARQSKTYFPSLPSHRPSSLFVAAKVVLLFYFSNAFAYYFFNFNEIQLFQCTSIALSSSY